MTEPNHEVERPWPTVILRRWQHHAPDEISSYSILPEGHKEPPSPHGREGMIYVPCDQAKAQALAEVRELQLRLADAYEVIATAVPRDEEGEPDYDKTEAVEEILGGGFFSALEFALTGGLGCLSEEEQAEKREAALREHREVLELSTLEGTQGEGT